MEDGSLIMGVNRDKPHLWKAGTAGSVDMYNEWFINFAPEAFRNTRIRTTKTVEQTLKATGNLTDIRTAILMEEGKLPPRMSEQELENQIEQISLVIEKIADPDIFVWLNGEQKPTR